MTLLIILFANLLVSFISIFTFGLLSINHKRLNSFLLAFIAFAAGALLGDAFIHILPESSILIGGVPAFVVALLGFSTFFLLEKILHYHHCPEANCENQDFEEKTLNPLAKLSLFSDGVHNFFDGLAIAASFLMSFPLGWATTFGIMVHEIPQELGDNAVLIYSGMRRRKVLFYNYLVSLTSMFGSLFAYFLGSRLNAFNNYVLPFVAGSFIYLAASDLIPELKEEKHFGHFILEFFGFLLGVGSMFIIWVIAK
jgi:zinc and cadmium transporter